MSIIARTPNNVRMWPCGYHINMKVIEQIVSNAIGLRLSMVNPERVAMHAHYICTDPNPSIPSAITMRTSLYNTIANIDCIAGCERVKFIMIDDQYVFACDTTLPDQMPDNGWRRINLHTQADLLVAYIILVHLGY